MPLSDREQGLLDDMEQNLHVTDPKLAASLIEHHPRSSASRALALPSAGITVGFGLVLTGLLFDLVAVSVLGFVLIVGAVAHVVGRRSMVEWTSRITTRRLPSANRPQ